MQNAPETHRQSIRPQAMEQADQSILTVKSYAQQVYALEANKDAARLAFLNFLINFYEPNTPITSLVFENFYQQAIGFSFWQENWNHLNMQVQYCVSQVAKRLRTGIVKSDWLQGDRMQAIRVQNSQNLSALIYKHLEASLNAKAQFKVFKTDEFWIAVILDDTLSVKIFTDTFILKDSVLTPASQDFQISYDSELMLKENVYQHVPIENHSSARFRMTDRGIVGRILRGYTFQKYAELNGGALSQYPEVFYPFKKIERLYVNLKTDPFYNEMVQALEQATNYLQKNDVVLDRSSRVYSQINSTLARARQGADAIFSNDKMLILLISNLEKTLALMDV